MSQERASWRRRLREGYEELAEKTREFNRELDGEIDHYITQIEEANNKTKEAIAKSLEDIFKVVRDHDDSLDRMRNRALDDMHRVA
eukprot:12083655-Karenia_brevis.AAC.1